MEYNNPWVSETWTAQPVQKSKAELEQLAKNQRYKIPRDHLRDYDFAQQWAIDRNTKTLSYEYCGRKITKTNYLYDPERGKMPNKYIYHYVTDHEGNIVIDTFTGRKVISHQEENPEYAKWFNNNKNMETASTSIETVQLKPLSFTFEDLNFQKLKRYSDGIQAKVFFDNGYGALIQKHEDSDGYPNNYEIHILAGTEKQHIFWYNSKLTNDYIGNLTEDQVIETLTTLYNYNHVKRVSNYPKKSYGWWYDQIVDDRICQMAKDDFVRQHGSLQQYGSAVSWADAINVLSNFSTTNQQYWKDNKNNIELYK